MKRLAAANDGTPLLDAGARRVTCRDNASRLLPRPQPGVISHPAGQAGDSGGPPGPHSRATTAASSTRRRMSSLAKILRR